MIYIVMFLISSLLICFYEKEKNGFRYVCLWLGLLLPILLGAFRNTSVGIDVMTYELPCWLIAKKTGSIISSLVLCNHLYGIEPLFIILTYLCSLFSNEIWILNFAIQIIITLCVFFSLKEINNGSLWFGMLTYYCLFYGESYNTMRQMIAISLVLLGLCCFLKKGKYLLFLFFIAIAILFHKSAIVALVYIGLYLCYKKNAKKLIYFFMFSVLFFVMFYKNVINFIVTSFSFIPERYAHEAYLSSVGGIYYKNIVIVLLGIICILIIDDVSLFGTVTKCIWIMLIIMIPFVNNSGYASRITGYFSITLVFLIPQTKKIVKKGKGNTLFYHIICVSGLVTYFIVNYFILDHAGIFPYKFIWNR